MEEKTLKVLLIRPMHRPQVVEMKDDLLEMQTLVGGYIEEWMPFDDDVALICNQDGKHLQMPPNRAIYDREGVVMDVIAGDFFLCYASIESESFESLPEDLMEKYQKMFQYPERFYREGNQIKVEQVFLKNRALEER